MIVVVGMVMIFTASTPTGMATSTITASPGNMA